MSDNKPNNPSLWSKAKAEAKRKYKVYPSAYANSYAAKRYKEMGGTWSKKKKKSQMKGGLDTWHKQKWVDISRKRKDGSHPPCGRKRASKSSKGYPKCVPAAKAAKMSDSQKASAVRRKRAKAQGVGGKPTNVSTKPKKRSK